MRTLIDHDHHNLQPNQPLKAYNCPPKKPQSQNKSIVLWPPQNNRLESKPSRASTQRLVKFKRFIFLQIFFCLVRNGWPIENCIISTLKLNYPAGRTRNPNWFALNLTFKWNSSLNPFWVRSEEDLLLKEGGLLWVVKTSLFVYGIFGMNRG